MATDGGEAMGGAGRVCRTHRASGVSTVTAVVVLLTSGCAGQSAETGRALPVTSMAEPVDAVSVPYAGTVQVDSRGCRVAASVTPPV